jgi:phenylacetate-CoA ligase
MSKLSTLFHKYFFLYPIYFLRNEPVFSFQREFHFVEKFNCDQLLEYQRKKLTLLFKRLVLDPFYKSIIEPYKDNLGKHDSFDILNRIPFLTKQCVRVEHNKRKRIFPFQLDLRTTSGSTGIPCGFYKDRRATASMEAVQNLVFSWHGISSGEPQARFWGMPSTGKAKAFAKCKDVIKNRARFSAFDLSDSAKELFYEKLLSFKPTHFYGYPSLILEFARFIKDKNKSGEKFNLKGVIGTGEFTYSYERKEIESLLNTKFINEYGCTETGVVAFDCPKGNLHVLSSNVIVEIIDENDSVLPIGEEGEIVVTELHSYYLPFIRYKLGDRGKLYNFSCSCGLPFEILELLSGRKDDYIITPEGRKIYDAILAYTLKKGVIQFKCYQFNLHELIIYIVPDEMYNLNLENYYISCLSNSISSTMNYLFIKTDKILRNESGKMSYFVSHILRT